MHCLNSSESSIMPPTSMSLCLQKKKIDPRIQFVFCELDMPFQAILLDFLFCVTMSLEREEKGRAGQGNSSVLLIWILFALDVTLAECLFILPQRNSGILLSWMKQQIPDN